MRLIRSIRVGSKCAVKIYRNVEHNEYVVKTLVNGKVMGGKSGGYFTDDKRDARGTAAHEIRWLRKHRPSCR